jgi:hypothetical protein
MSRRRPVVLVAVTMLVVSVLTFSFVAEAKPSGGNNKLNAKACQGTGYQSLYRQDGTGFTNADECASYAAQGGVLATATPTATLTPTPTNTPSPTPDPRTITLTNTVATCQSTEIGPALQIELLVSGSGFRHGDSFQLSFGGSTGFWDYIGDSHEMVTVDGNGNFSTIATGLLLSPYPDPIEVTVTVIIPFGPTGSILIPLSALPVC